MVGAFGVPALLRVRHSPCVVVLLVWAAPPVGLLVVPSGRVVGCALGGAAQGGGIAVIFPMVVRRARDLAENRRVSALVQGGGYTAAGPAVGAVHEVTGGWTAPLPAVGAAVLVPAVSGTRAARPRLLARWHRAR